MIEKQNFYIDSELLKKSNNGGNITETITKALKLAYDNKDDFIMHTREWLYGSEKFTGSLKLEHLVEGDQLKYNLFVRQSGLQLFIQKNTFAKIKNGLITFDDTKIKISQNILLKATNLENNFNMDNTCIEIDLSEE